MSESSAIEWTDATWNPVTGCTRVSAGCQNCYAERLTATRLAHQPRYAGLATMVNGEARWSNEIRLHEDLLDQPLRWCKPRRIFVCSTGDLFHPKVPFEFIDKVFAVMALADRHTFQVLTKRPERIAEYLADLDQVESRLSDVLWRERWPMRSEQQVAAGRDRLDCGVPLPNLWLGTSVEDQAAADERIPNLLRCPAPVRFLSCEPLLGRIELPIIEDSGEDMGPVERKEWGLPARMMGDIAEGIGPSRIHWVIVGGETGPGARPMELDWARSIRDQCQTAGVPFFLKQIRGAKKKAPRDATLDGRTWDEMPRLIPAATGVRP